MTNKYRKALDVINNQLFEGTTNTEEELKNAVNDLHDLVVWYELIEHLNGMGEENKKFWKHAKERILGNDK